MHRDKEQAAKISFAFLVLGVAVHVLFLVSLKTGWLNPLFNDSMHRFGPGDDFFSIYAAGVKARLGESIYTVGGHVDAVPYAYAFRYAPIVAYTLGFALSAFPALTAYTLWLVICELTLLRNIRLTVERASTKSDRYLTAALWLLFSPYYLELFVGQFTFITASLILWAYLSWTASATELQLSRLVRPMGDLCFGGAIWLKMMPLLYLPIAILYGRWRSALFTVLILVGTSWAYFSIHPQDWLVFTETNIKPTPTWHAGNMGLTALMYAVVDTNEARFIRVHRVIAGIISCGLLWLLWGGWSSLRKCKRQSEATPATHNEVSDSVLALYAAFSAAYLLLYKDVWEHHYVLLLPPLVLLALAKKPLKLWLVPFLISALPTPFVWYDVNLLGYNEDPQQYWLSSIVLLHHAWKPLAPLWLFVGIILLRSPAPSMATSIFARFTKPGRFQENLKRMNQVALVVIAGFGFVIVSRWTSHTIDAQKRRSRQLTWPPSVFQKQLKGNTCGPAALAAVCRHFNIPATEDEIARLSATTHYGTTMFNLQQAAEAKGLVAEGRSVTLSQLAHIPCPCILFFHPGHFAVLTGAQGGRFYIADPSLGERVWSAQQLSHFWKGELLLVGPTQ